ncbi:cellulose binding domain-containing protein [Actinoplanes sp. NPDC026619]|uniref:cellulose binding domain-containing protein n=1 Tax=Actinoplanes sp. NPDC026619 TaxID=3155798 RepID=UPI0033F59DA2
MPPKHSARPLGPARIVLSAAVAVLVMMVVWIAVRAVGPAEAAHTPALVLDTASPSPSVSRTVSPSPSRTSASPKATKHTPVPGKTTTKPSASKPTATKAARSSDLAATLSVAASWEQGYVAAVRIRNNGRTAQSWTVTVSNNGLSNLRLTGTWNARGSQSGSRLTFTGDGLAPGSTFTFGYQVSSGGRGKARPSGCSVVGGACSVG